MSRNRTGTVALSLFAVLFGLLTIVVGGSVLFNETAAETMGNYVPFVLVFNFVAGFFYVIAGLGMLKEQTWAARLSMVIAASTILVFVAFGVHVFSGGLYENQTPVALTLRSFVWTGLTLWQWPMLTKDRT